MTKEKKKGLTVRATYNLLKRRLSKFQGQKYAAERGIREVQDALKDLQKNSCKHPNMPDEGVWQGIGHGARILVFKCPDCGFGRVDW
jgi:hypothetical protein